MNREYPSRPIPAVASTVIEKNRILLVRRANEPSKGLWGLPGGVVELGETLAQAVVREVKEETGIDVEIINFLDVLDSINRDDDGRIRFHYVIFECLAKPINGEIQAAADASEALWVSIDELDKIEINPFTLQFIKKMIKTGKISAYLVK